MVYINFTISEREIQLQNGYNSLKKVTIRLQNSPKGYRTVTKVTKR